MIGRFLQWCKNGKARISVTGHIRGKVQEKMESVDRRIQKTKKILSESLIALILEKGYENVTVQEIIDRANVGRSTFYSHYESKDQLLLAGPENLGIRFFEAGDPAKPGAAADGPDLLPLFRHAGRNLALAKAMIGRKSGDVFTSHLKHRIGEMVREKFRHRFGKSKQEKIWQRYFCDAAAATVMGFLIAWLEDDMPFPEAEIAETCARAVARMFKDR